MQVNNAGTAYLKPAADLTLEETSRLMTTNFESCFHLSQLFYPLLKDSGRGSIVNISSVASVLAFHSLPIYSAAKGEKIKLPLCMLWTSCPIAQNNKPSLQI